MSVPDKTPVMTVQTYPARDMATKSLTAQSGGVMNQGWTAKDADLLIGILRR